ncbi:hypothetical protein PIB30_043867 [Stylosanthes scabra]|uniref:Secreted protein n=1 Tax=Stylosanthes scabra TaxID=79078 RepID=A0ABU6QG63_9FABA|nr:hypothetical protein [Stylosanthes scabra]
MTVLILFPFTLYIEENVATDMLENAKRDMFIVFLQRKCLWIPPGATSAVTPRCRPRWSMPSGFILRRPCFGCVASKAATLRDVAATRLRLCNLPASLRCYK